MKLVCQKLYTLFALALVAIIAAFSSALAIGGEGHGPPPGLDSLVLPGVNFGIYFFLILFAYFKYGRKLLAQRSITLEQKIERAANLLTDAESEFNSLKSRLRGIADERRSVVRELEEDARTLAANIAAYTRKHIEELRLESNKRTEAELEKAKDDIRVEIVELATNIARKRLAVDLSESEDRRLRAEVVTELR